MLPQLFDFGSFGFVVSDVGSVSLLPAVEFSIIRKFSVGIGTVKPFSPEFIFCIFPYDPGIVTDIPGTVVFFILLPVWNIGCSAYSCRCLPFTVFAVLFFEMND